MFNIITMLGNKTKWYDISKHLHAYDKKHKYFTYLYYTEDEDFVENHNKVSYLQDKYYANKCIDSEFSYVQFNIDHGFAHPPSDFTTYSSFKGHLLNIFCTENDPYYDDYNSDYDSSCDNGDGDSSGGDRGGDDISNTCKSYYYINKPKAPYNTLLEFVEFIDKDMCTDITTIDKNLNATIKPGQKITKLNFIRFNYILKFELNPLTPLTNGMLLYACTIADRVSSRLKKDHAYNVKYAGHKRLYEYMGNTYRIECDNTITSHDDELFCDFTYST